ncbi:uncharacterized protein LOC117639590 [Thrips palmi]|uniref:Uncharacterized protein LOC117639590 n=1 Tax=Thrips palmi TaxID=161013 RepID=A0A6P8Y5P0_THRPL|nr:uncharacterized protein LOC117639590 [Thrips palmi]
MPSHSKMFQDNPPADWDPETLKEVIAKQRQYCDQLLASKFYRVKLQCLCTDECCFFENRAEISTLLRERIGNVVCGKSKGYDTEETKKIDRVLQCLEKEEHIKNNGVDIAMIVISLITGNRTLHVPVFRVNVPSQDSGEQVLQKNFFVDLYGRRYKSFDDFLSNNKLPKGKICYPEKGIYCLKEGEVMLQHGTTSGCAPSGLDLFVGAVSVFALPLLVFSPPVAGSILGASAFYSGVRSVLQLRDRATHDQSLMCKETCWLWLRIAAAGYTFVGSGLLLGNMLLAADPALPISVAFSSVISFVMLKEPECFLKVKNMSLPEMFQAVIKMGKAWCSFKKRCSVDTLEALALKAKPYVFSKIDSALEQKFDSSEEMLSQLGNMLSDFPRYGPALNLIFRAVLAYFNVGYIYVDEAKKYLKETVQYLRLCYAAERLTSKSLSELEAMCNIVNDPSTISQLIVGFQCKTFNYHLPCGHANAVDIGEISQGNYFSILKNYMEKEIGTTGKFDYEVMNDGPGRFWVDHIGVLEITVQGEMVSVNHITTTKPTNVCSDLNPKIDVNRQWR